MAAGEDDFDLVSGVSDIEDECSDAVAGLKLLAGDLLGAWHERFGAVDLDDEGAAFVALDGARGDVADALAEFGEDGLAFVVAEALDHDLLGGLRGDAAEGVEGDVLAFAFVEVSPEGEGSFGGIELGAECFGVEGVVVLPQCGDHGLFDVVEEDFAFDFSVACDAVDESDDFLDVHGCVFSVSGCLVVFPRSGVVVCGSRRRARPGFSKSKAGRLRLLVARGLWKEHGRNGWGGLPQVRGPS